jgi:nucleotide sugar dehydrogenase
MEKKIGFIGQGWIGKNYADDFEKRGFEVVRYSLEEEYIKNKDLVKECDIVFIAVPTPTTPTGFDASLVKEAIKLVGLGKIVLIKSTLLPGTTEDIQAENPGVIILHSPEFLTRSTAQIDVSHPPRNIIGIAKDNDEYRKAANLILEIVPKAPFNIVCPSKDAELIKYMRNCQGYFRVIFANLAFDLSNTLGANWQNIEDAMAADPFNGGYYYKPNHDSGRGAGGPCYIKDFSAFSKLYQEKVGDVLGDKILESLQAKNIDLLVKSGKDMDLLTGVYGEDFINEMDK